MVFPVNITDGGNELVTTVYKPKNSDHGSNDAGIVAYVHPRDEYDGINKVFFNSSNGVNMAVDGSITPTITESVWSNGVGYTTTALSGTWDFASTDTFTGWPPAGTLSVDGTATVNNDEAEFDKGSALNLSSYDFVRGCIFITSWPTSGTKQVLLELRDASDVVVGNAVDIGGYVNTSDFNTDQEFIIPLSDLNAVGDTIQKIVIRVVDIGGGQAPNFYLAELKIQDGGNGFTYEISPNAEKTLFVDRITIQMERTYNVTTSNQHAVGMTGFLGSGTLTNGILTGLEVEGSKPSGLTANFKDLRNWLIFPQIVCRDISTFGDGTNTTLRFQLDFEDIGGLRLRPRFEEKLFYTIQDDLSGFDFFQVWADCHEVFDESGQGN